MSNIIEFTYFFILRVRVLYPCQDCCGVVFCSPRCRSKAKFHEYECKILDYLKTENFSSIIFLALRFLTCNSLQRLYSIRKDLKILHPSEIIKGGQIRLSDISLMMNLSFGFSTSNLIKFKMSITVVFILDLLDFSGYFDSDYKMSDKIFVGSLLMKFIKSCTKYPISISKDQEDRERIYPILAFFPQSDNPFLYLELIHDRTILKGLAAKNFKKGDQIFMW